MIRFVERGGRRQGVPWYPFIVVAIMLSQPIPAAAAEATAAMAELAFRTGDYKRAESLARDLAGTGDAKAQYLLGQLYTKGLGVSQNHYEAARWYRKSAEQGNPEAETALGQSFELGRGVGRNYGEAARWYRLAADRGETEAQFLIGQMYDRGYGVSQDVVLAYVWYSLAVGNNAAPSRNFAEVRRSAAQRRTSVRFRMTPDQIAEAEDLAASWQKVNSR
jgi:TPR repeat protein